MESLHLNRRIINIIHTQKKPYISTDIAVDSANGERLLQTKPLRKIQLEKKQKRYQGSAWTDDWYVNTEKKTTDKQSGEEF